MNKKEKYYIVEESVLPDIIVKVLETKKLLDNKKCKNITEAVKITGISRSAFYKYANKVEEFYNNQILRTVTIGIEIIDAPGMLNKILKEIAKFELNVLTINQSIPLNNIAYITITLEESQHNAFEQLFEDLKKLEFLRNLRILGRG